MINKIICMKNNINWWVDNIIPINPPIVINLIKLEIIELKYLILILHD